MGEDINSILRGKGGRFLGAIVGLVIGIIIVIPKFFLLIICIVIGYFAGKYFDEKSRGEVLRK